jgi:hypothetical protein
MNKPTTCSICQGPLEPDPEKAKIWPHGNNAQPVNDGRCCDRCNYEVVIPARLRLPACSLGTYSQHKEQLEALKRMQPPS